MITLSTLKNTSRPHKRYKRVGRGPGSGLGKTCGRGEKGAGSRSGYKRRYGYEGGQFRTFMKMPERGFSNERFRKPLESINLGQIDRVYQDGEVVNLETLAAYGFISGRPHGLKILGKGEITKKITIHANAFSETAKEKLQKAKIKFTIIEKGQETAKDAE